MKVDDVEWLFSFKKFSPTEKHPRTFHTRVGHENVKNERNFLISKQRCIAGPINIPFQSIPPLRLLSRSLIHRIHVLFTQQNFFSVDLRQRASIKRFREQASSRFCSEQLVST
jgi:hypothetical protein